MEESPSAKQPHMATDICIHWDPQVSSTHAELDRIADDWALLDDRLSTNGTFVNGERLQGLPLRAGISPRRSTGP